MSVLVKIKEAFSRDLESGEEEHFEVGEEVNVSVEEADSWETKGLAKRVKPVSAPAAGETKDKL